MPPNLPNPIKFGRFVVNSQIFYVTPLSFALVNLKPLVPGHVLVSPIRVVPRVSDLSAAEVTDLFLAVQKVGRMVQRVFKASALNIAIQDGPAAGQSVPHVHAHVIPRSQADMDDRGGTDAIYDMMNGEQGDIGKHQKDHEESGRRIKFPKVDDNSRKPRSEADMQKEAEWLFEQMQQD